MRFLCLLVCACSPAPVAEAPKPAPVTIPESEPLREPDPAKETPRDPLRTDVRELSRVACTVSSPEGRWLRALPLRFSDGGPAFATAGSVAAELALSASGPRGGGRVAIEADGFALRGRIAAADLELTPAGAYAHGVVVPDSGAELSWVGSQSDRVRVALSIQGPVAPSAPAEWSSACSELSLAVREFDARSATGLGKPLRFEFFDTKDPVTLSTRADGGESLTLNVADGNHRVEVHAVEGARTRILFEAPNCILFGWIDSKHVKPLPLGTGNGFGSGTGRIGRRHVSLKPHTCDADMPITALIGEAGEQRGVVGAVRAGTTFWTRHTPDDQGFFDLGRLPDWLSPDENASLAIARDALDSCQNPEPK